MAAHQGVIEESPGRHAHTGRLLPAHVFSSVDRSVSSDSVVPFLLTECMIAIESTMLERGGIIDALLSDPWDE